MQEPCHKLNEHCMAVFWVWRLPSLPLWFLVSNSISSWGLVRVRTRWHLDGTSKKPICLHITPMNLSQVGCPIVSSILIVSLPCHGDQIQQLISLHILNQSSQILRGESYWSLIREVIGSQTLTKK